MPVRIYVVEDHPIMRETLQDYLSLDVELEICGMAESAEEASDELEAASPDVVLVDLSLPGRSGLELVAEIGLRWGTPCVILSGHGERTYVGRALAGGAKGYVLKGSQREITLAIRQVLRGEIYVSPSLLEDMDNAGGESGA